MADKITVRLRGLVRAAGVRRLGGADTVLVDIDGTMTDGLLHIQVATADGVTKPFKSFSSDDSDALRLLSQLGVRVILVSADGQGSAILEQRAKDIGVEWYIVPGMDRFYRLQEFAEVAASRVVYIGDGYWDGSTFQEVGFGIATANALHKTKKMADAILSRSGGNKAIAQAVDYIIERLMV